ncbi:MAG: GIY-YIG nuclease family protein [Proteobacteria bacterium]|nr:GIY-YIG nuclease family protein [Pseudomonadota bacterium]MCH9735762.1 GIY-YIG nuclease family protein [Actinomycetes bacterium]
MANSTWTNQYKLEKGKIYLAVLRVDETIFYKIGYTLSEPRLRVESWLYKKNINAEILELIYFKTKEPFKKEQHIHKQLCSYSNYQELNETYLQAIEIKTAFLTLCE